MNRKRGKERNRSLTREEEKKKNRNRTTGLIYWTHAEERKETWFLIHESRDDFNESIDLN